MLRPILWVREPGNISGFPWAADSCEGFRLELAGMKYRPVALIAVAKPLHLQEVAG